MTLPRLAVALTGLFALLSPLAPASAATGDIFYRATFAAKPAKERLVARELLFGCTGTTCVAAKGPARDASICSALARAGGELVAFQAGTKTFSADELAACNGKSAA
ncbi:MAG: hypothetical protein U5M50_15390 [Sphingobium sp.]|nr:hypothetical protein [Sphingobium sp.]